MGDKIFRRALRFSGTCLGLSLRIERDVDAAQEGRIASIMLEVSIEVGHLRDIDRISGVQSMIAIGVEAGNLAERRTWRVRQPRHIASCQRQGQRKRRGENRDGAE